MHPRIPGALSAGSILVAVILALPVHAGGTWSKQAAKHGYFARNHGAPVFHTQKRNLTNGVNIFSTRIRNLPDGVNIFHRQKSAPHPSAGKPRKREHAESLKSRAARHASLPHKTRKRGSAMDHVGDQKKTLKRRKKHAHHKKPPIVYASTVYIVKPDEEYIYPEHEDEENCRRLTERGYDTSGRRVLVEWTLCFDDQGEAYVPADGRRIVARF